jgi:ABC-type amino acid transport substrate-binding protein
MVRIVDGGKALNIDATAINLTDEERSAYFVSAREVRARTDAINHELNSWRESGEKEIDALQDKYLGIAIFLETAPEEVEEEAA